MFVEYPCDLLVETWHDLYFTIMPYVRTSRKDVGLLCSKIIEIFRKDINNKTEFLLKVGSVFKDYGVKIEDANNKILSTYYEFYMIKNRFIREGYDPVNLDNYKYYLEDILNFVNDERASKSHNDFYINQEKIYNKRKKNENEV